MKSIVPVILAFVLFAACKSSQEVLAAKPEVMAVKDAKGNLVGKGEKSQLLEAPFNSWYTSNYDKYEVDAKVVKQLKPKMKGVTVTTFMGTWCGDSKRNVPKFYKIMEQAGVSEDAIQLITVNRKKKTTEGFEKGLDILRVPTFIFYKEGKEIGRFVERPRETMEKDFLKILSGEPYKHAYEK